MITSEETLNCRVATPYEINRISRFIENRNKKEIKLCKTLDVIFTAAGLFFLGCLATKPDNMILGIIFGAISFVIVFFSLFNKKNVISEISAYKEGLFLVKDAHIVKSVVNPQLINRRHIWVKADLDGEESGAHEIYDEGETDVGAPVIIVYPNSSNIRKKANLAFTPYMLSDEFLNKK